MSSGSGANRALFGIYGKGGCGRGVLPVADAMLRTPAAAGPYELVFIDDDVTDRTVNGRRVLGFGEFLQEDAAAKAVSLAISNPAVRAELDAKCRGEGVDFFTVTSPETVIMDDVTIGEGAILSPFVTLTSNIRIGRHFHANLYACVEHDCRIGDFVTFAPGVRCNGNVVIGDGAYLGAGCIIRQGTPGEALEIGTGAVVGMGAVVTKSVPPGVTVVGNPARPL